MLLFSLCQSPPSEPSRRGIGTWRRQPQSQAPPRCRRLVSTRSNAKSQRGAVAKRTCRPRTIRWNDGPTSPARHHGRPVHTSVPIRSSTECRAAQNDQAHNMAQRSAVHSSRTELDSEGNCLRKARPRRPRRKRPLRYYSPALLKRSQLALFCCSVPEGWSHSLPNPRSTISWTVISPKLMPLSSGGVSIWIQAAFGG